MCKKRNDEPRQCFVILATEYDEGFGYVPCLVTENEPGYGAMRGNGEGATPWYWGKTMERAEEVCAHFNQERYGISKATATRIVCSSMFCRETVSPASWQEGT